MGAIMLCGSILITGGFLLWFKRFADERRQYFEGLCDIIEMTGKTRHNPLVASIYYVALDALDIDEEEMYYGAVPG